MVKSVRSAARATKIAGSATGARRSSIPLADMVARVAIKRLLPGMAALLLAAMPISVSAQDSDGMLVVRVQELLEEVRELRGLVESQQREIDNLRRRQRDQYLDLDQRLQQLGRDGVAVAPILDQDDQDPRGPAETAGDDRPVEPSVAQAPRADVPEVRAPIDAQPEITTLPMPAAGGPRDLGTPTDEEQAAYDRAFRALRETRYADAANAFSDFLDQYPDSAYAPNAQYWLAETYYVTRDFETALNLFKELLDRFPGSNKEPDALLKIGFSHFELRQWNEARAALEQVRAQYPNTTLARLAEGRLRDMRLAGHF
ncbi:MAG: tol-pal system protein YbgF [Wenzhouxiangella sp.]|nr:MAG: tol-pal system protein YbgF [Wenzhouxiangella sp.]